MIKTVEVILTSKVNTLIKRNATFALFSTTSTSYVVVTDAEITGIVATYNYVWWCRARNTAGASYNAQLHGSVSGLINTVASASNSTFAQHPTTSLQFFIAVTETLSVQIRAVASGTVEVEANSFTTIESELSNITDFNQKIQVTELKIFSIDNTLRGLEGIFSQFSDENFTQLTLDNVMSKFIFSHNDSKMLFDWSGFKIGVA